MTTTTTTSTYSGWLWKAPLTVLAGLAISAVVLAALFAVFEPNLFSYYIESLAG